MVTIPRRPAVLEVPDFKDYRAPASSLTRWRAGPMIVGSLLQKLLDQSWGQAAPFMLSKPFFDDSGAAEAWLPSRLLGQGGFGCVGLWHITDANGNITDELAIKEVYRQITYSRALDVERTPGLSSEAVIQRDLNLLNEPTIVHLRGYKLFPHEHMHRLYLMYCPNGELMRLCRLYNMWDQFFPELFIWHVFHSLALAVQAMNHDMPAETEARPLHPNGSPYKTIHFDLKPNNVFLDYPDPAYPLIDPLSQYPSVKLGDFGLAAYTNMDDRYNPGLFWHRGTPNYKPPENRGYGAEWQTPPTGASQRLNPQTGQLYPSSAHAWQVQMHDNERDIVFSNAHNIFCIAKIVYDLLNLSTGGRFERIEAKTQQDFVSNGNHSIPIITTLKVPEYTSDLRDLVRQCLHPNPATRPSINALLQSTRHGLDIEKGHVMHARQMAGDVTIPTSGEKVCITMDEFNRLLPGTARRPPRVDDFNWIMGIGRSNYFDESWPAPLLPLPKWAALLGYQRPPRPRFQVPNVHIRFGNPNQQPNAAGANAGPPNNPVPVNQAPPNPSPPNQALPIQQGQNQNAPARLPTRVDYNRWDKGSLAVEVYYRDPTQNLTHLLSSAVSKDSLMNQLQAMDQAGNYGHGANLGQARTRRNR